jgi:hypothetical protein
MMTVSQLKGGGYLTSALSVALLAVPALKSASENDLLLACLILGILSSISGMALRWRSHRLEQKEKDRLERKAEAGPPRGAFPTR